MKIIRFRSWWCDLCRYDKNIYIYENFDENQYDNFCNYHKRQVHKINRCGPQKIRKLFSEKE